ncbi:MAG: metalloregulator ArsR/SmtB family transcription factor [Mariprofundaceae bacterium]|nr:metalloregulator ArsR/SmtB family transcription factor [Mariprofundaceae bacterium]
MSANRDIKSELFEQVARLAKAVSSPKRLELLDLLCQAPKPVEALAREAGISDKLASAHLKALRNTRLVITERQGKQIIYRPASPDVPRFLLHLRGLAEERLNELQEVLHQLAANTGEWRTEERSTLLRKAKSGDIIVIDVRPADEYAQKHLPFARSLPLAELRERLSDLPRDKTIVAYCRGPFCLMSADAVRLLQNEGFDALQLREGVMEWSEAVERAANL